VAGWRLGPRGEGGGGGGGEAEDGTVGMQKVPSSPGMQHGRKATANCRTGWGNRWRPYSAF
jgi:hypothetical protein